MNYLVIGGMMTCEGVQHQVRNLKLMLNLYLFLNISLLFGEKSTLLCHHLRFHFVLTKQDHPEPNF